MSNTIDEILKGVWADGAYAQLDSDGVAITCLTPIEIPEAKQAIYNATLAEMPKAREHGTYTRHTALRGSFEQNYKSPWDVGYNQALEDVTKILENLFGVEK